MNDCITLIMISYADFCFTRLFFFFSQSVCCIFSKETRLCTERSDITTARVLVIQLGCHGYGDSHGDFNGYGYGMDMGTVMNPHGPEGIRRGLLNGCEIKRKRVKYAINFVVDV